MAAAPAGGAVEPGDATWGVGPQASEPGRILTRTRHPSRRWRSEACALASPAWRTTSSRRRSPASSADHLVPDLEW